MSYDYDSSDKKGRSEFYKILFFIILSIGFHYYVFNKHFFKFKTEPIPSIESQNLTYVDLDKIQTRDEESKKIASNLLKRNLIIPKTNNSQLAEANNSANSQTSVKENSASTEANKLSKQSNTVTDDDKLNLMPSFAKNLFTQETDNDNLNVSKNENPSETTSNSLYGNINRPYIMDLPNSDDTQLNTREYKYYSYFSRIKETIESWWKREIHRTAIKMARNGRIPQGGFSSDDKTTKLLIKLDSKGEIIKMIIMSSAGIKEFDDAAIRTFNEAGGFPNPPLGLLNTNKEIEIEWRFTVKT